ncbi:MAG: PilZ domain-containing protein [Acidobacteria bacterium]|nr:PilZ domain-containing protein [Acidobacteriota bacterium]
MVQGVERRKYPRAYFTVKDGITAVFELPGPEKFAMSTNILSLSEGGISFIGQREALENLTTEDEVLLVRLIEPQKLQFLQRVLIQVRHTINEPEMKHIVCGCHFININTDQRKGISEFVDNMLDPSN